MPPSSVTLNILRSYYPVVLTVQDYLAQILGHRGNPAAFLIHETDTIPYRSLLTNALVCSRYDPIYGTINVASPMVHFREIIENAQREMLTRAKGKGRTSDVLVAGYSLKRPPGQQGRATLQNYFVNTIVTALDSPEWDSLFQSIGEDAMYHLLTETCLFMSLPNGCYCQMNGEFIVLRSPPPLQPSAPSVDPQEPIVDNMSDSHRQHKRRRPPQSNIPIVRARMFYFRPHYVQHTNLLVIGLPPGHALNRLHASRHLRPENVRQAFMDVSSREQAARSRHLAKYVFPRQFGLANPFVVDFSVFSVHKLPDYSDREKAITALGPVKTPQRIKAALPLLEQLIWHHSKCGYKPILQRVCPSKVINERNQPLDSSIILEMVSEHSIQLHSQAVISDPSISHDIGSTTFGSALSQIQRQAKHKPRFAEFACSHAEVYYYAVCVTKAVVPLSLWGSEKNFKVICRHVKSFISARRYETLTLHEIMQDFSISDCDWLMPAKPQARVNATDTLKRLELAQEFLFWYFDSFIVPLLRTTFYVTESSAFRNKVLYFRQDDWATLCAPLIAKLSGDTFQKITQGTASEIMRQRTLGFSFVRLLPKETGVRPIVNLRRKKVATKYSNGQPQLSINQILQAAFQVLTYEKNAQKHLLGASVFGHNEVYTKLKTYKVRLESLSPDGSLPKLYFVKVDVQACFDTITQDKLLSILRKLISEDVYVTQRYGTVTLAAGKIKRTYVKTAMPDDDHPHFISIATKLAETLRNTIFVDQVVYPYTQKKDMLQLLEEHITENIVKIGNDYYRQTIGIPQGSVLSTLLCSFFYGDLERNELKFAQDSQSTLLRLVDDYLLVTTSQAKAKKFLDVMKRGHPEYGCFISKEKILSNLDAEDLMNTVHPGQPVFPWCGYLINMRDLSVSVDYSRFHPTYLSDSLTVDTGRKAATTFLNKMLQLVKSRGHIIYTDAHLNTGHVIYCNVYRNFMSVAMKMHYYLRSWKLDIAKSSRFLQKSIHQIIVYAHAAMKNKAEHKIAKASSAQFDVQKIQVLWLGTHAFHTVLSRKAHVYTQVLKALEFELSLPRYRRFKRRFRAVTKDGLEMFTLLTF
ncbi:hypothetical protein EIP91_003447 [Steccherinum ochraceum]|uniref:Telomerase reverse transcriptase n=1 Tax=Steccherinum ochraceum TaxID=92696 RepID=A0A4R0RAH9_9APHY|nr:hypothetical protein EIP91_003447 [Steccherinum ochraceum]